MKRLAAALLLALLSAVVAAQPDPRFEAVRGLGSLNGVALACGYLDQTRRMKQALVDHLPRERAYGLAFDESTDQSFRGFLGRHGTCPGKAGFAGDVDGALETLGRTFAAGGG